MTIAIVCPTGEALRAAQGGLPQCAGALSVRFFPPESPFPASIEERDAFDAVFCIASAPRLCEAERRAFAPWVGHPHLRQISGSEIGEKLITNIAFLQSDNSCEIERKLLIRYPDLEQLGKEGLIASAELEQTYLLSPDPLATERIRRRTSRGRSIYTHTVKRRLTMRTAEENEEKITENQYFSLLLRRDPARKPILKTRVCYLSDGKYFEIDLYPFWSDRAILELELLSEDEPFTVPQTISVIREVTEDVRYKNARLAKCVPNVPIE